MSIIESQLKFVAYGVAELINSGVLVGLVCLQVRYHVGGLAEDDIRVNKASRSEFEVWSGDRGKTAP
ncbi:MAG: hypothetical protein K2X93_09230 [Candidatus Obscuribacterales bacterium]|nr:hypothetical protein [Candidatus Obscuribacterales bacterium]